MELPESYPYEPPSVTWVTKIFHMNIDPQQGYVCLEILKPNGWSPMLTMLDGQFSPRQTDLVTGPFEVVRPLSSLSLSLASPSLRLFVRLGRSRQWRSGFAQGTRRGRRPGTVQGGQSAIQRGPSPA